HAGGDVILRKRVSKLEYFTIAADNAIEITGGLVLATVTTLDAGGTLTLDGSVFPGIATLNGAAGVTLRKLVSPYTLRVTSSGGAVDVDATVRGLKLRFRAPSGNVTLAGRFTADVIEATAANDLTASGRFDPNCIALTAGGTLDTTAATFAVPPVPDCP